MRADDEHNEDPKQPKPILHRKKVASHREQMEANGRTKLQSDELDRHRHV